MSSTITKTKADDLELVICYYVRNEFENKWSQTNVPVALKYLIKNFAKKFISSIILNNDNQITFYNLLSKSLSPIKHLTLLYRASDNEYSIDKFHDLCDKNGETITIVRSAAGNVFGGYTSKQWNHPQRWILPTTNMLKDYDAFLFLVESNDESLNGKLPMKMEAKPFSRNYGFGHIYHSADNGPWFGNDFRIGHNCNKPINKLLLNDYKYTRNLSWSSSNCCSFKWQCDSLTGSKINHPKSTDRSYFQVIEYEVFRIEYVNDPTSDNDESSDESSCEDSDIMSDNSEENM